MHKKSLWKLSTHLWFSSVQWLSCVQLFVTPWTAVHQASLSITNSRSLFKLMSIQLVMPSNHFILCCPLLLAPSIFHSITIFSNESVLYIRRPKYWSFSLKICPTKEHSGLISFRMGWLDLLAVQGTLKSLQHSVFFIVQLSYPYMTTGKTIALTRQTFLGKVMSLIFNMLYRLVIAFLPRSKHLLISWLKSPSAVIKNPMDRGAWWAAVHGVAKSRTRLSDFTVTFHFRALEKGMVTHSSVLAWIIPGTVEPVYGVAQSQTRLKRFSSSSSSILIFQWSVTLNCFSARIILDVASRGPWSCSCIFVICSIILLIERKGAPNLWIKEIFPIHFVPTVPQP